MAELDYKQWEQGRETYLYLQRMGYFSGYDIVGSGDSKECEVCQAMQGHYDEINDNNPLPPFHPNCRCKVKLNWLPNVNPEKIYAEFFDQNTGEIKSLAGQYSPTKDLLTNAVNYFWEKKYGLDQELTWEEISPEEIYDAKDLVGEKLEIGNINRTYKENQAEEFYYNQAVQKQMDFAWSFMQNLRPNQAILGNTFKKLLEDDKTEKLLDYWEKAYAHASANEDSLQTAEIGGREVTLQKKALDSLLKINMMMILDGIEYELTIDNSETGSYRSAEKQRELIERNAEKYNWEELSEEEKNIPWGNKYYKDYVEQDLELFKKWRWVRYEKGYTVDLPGRSNHQGGLAVDVKYFSDTEETDRYLEIVKPYLENNGWNQPLPEDDKRHFDYLQ